MAFQSATRLILVAILLFCSTACIEGKRRRRGKRQNRDFDFFYFVLQWPGSYCDSSRNTCCYPSSGKPKADFSIHGLWPNFDDGSWPSNCQPTPFYPSTIAEMKDKLEENWPSLSCPSNNGETFWEHEWDKHGTCSHFEEYDYFETALRIKDSVNVLSVLEAAQIRPDGGMYAFDTIRKVLSSAMGGSVGVECNSDRSGNTQLYQIYFCVDKSASGIIPCPILPSSQCSDTVEFPSF